MQPSSDKRASRSSANDRRKELQRCKQIINASLEAIDLALRQLNHVDRLIIAAEAARRMQTKITNSAVAIRDALAAEQVTLEE